jgi:multicomponent Na+:H+ antiporter subunit A
VLAFLIVFALAPLAVPPLTRLLGRRVFVILALIPAAAFAYTLTQTPAMLSESPPTEVVPWIPQLAVSLAVSLDALSWLLALVVTGIGALVLLY